MDVTCNRCGMTYEFEVGLIAPAGTTVKCTECGHLFKVLRPTALTPSAEESATWQRSWRVRQADGTLHVIESLAEVIRLIGTGQFGPEDEISRTGQVWKRLGTIAELSSLFARSANTIESSHGATLLDVPPTRERRRSPRESEVPELEDAARSRKASPVVELNTPRRRPSTPPRPPRPATDSRPPPAPESLRPAELAVAVPPARRSVRNYLGLLAVAGALLATGSVAAIVLVPASERKASANEARMRQLLGRAEQSLAAHRPSGFELAIEGYEQALQLDPDDPRTLGAVSRAHAIWSQWLRARLGPAERGDALLESEMLELKAQARRHAEAAQRYARRAVQLAPARGSVGVAWSDALRLAGDLPAAQEALARAQVDADAPRAEVLRVAALLAIDLAGGNAGAGRVLAEQAVAEEPTSLRSRFLLLQCLIGASALDAARSQLRSLQELDPTHPSLPAYAAQLDAVDQSQHGQLERRDVGSAAAMSSARRGHVLDARVRAGY